MNFIINLYVYCKVMFHFTFSSKIPIDLLDLSVVHWLLRGYTRIRIIEECTRVYIYTNTVLIGVILNVSLFSLFLYYLLYCTIRILLLLNICRPDEFNGF